MKIYNFTIYLILLLVLFSITSCDKGLHPPPPMMKSSISGLITYVNGKDKWPEPDSVLDIRVAMFKVYPPQDILTELLSGNAYFTDSLPRFVDSSSYFIEISNPPEEIKYIVVAQQFGSILDWKAVGVYTVNGNVNEPSSILVEPGIDYKNINIKVNFDSLPPQPFLK